MFCVAARMCHIFSHIINTVIIKKLENSLQLIENVPPYVQFRPLVGTVASNINELPFALRANAHFAVPDITFLAKHPVTFFSYICQCNNSRSKGRSRIPLLAIFL
jgi:hypothetical protein